MDNTNIEVANPLVSILCVTYNHKDYIKQCLDGFVMQKTNFKFLAYVGDDCSTDGTTEIVREYEKKYPHIIKGIYHKQNTGGEDNFFDVANACKSKYVALCEGDDYWIDEYKLQKQVDFLESNPDYAICFHPVKVVYEGFDFKKTDEIYPAQEFIKNELTFDLFLENNWMATNSVVYRWEFNDKDIEKYFPKDIMPGDWYLHLLHAKEGKIKILTDVMAVYRRNPGGTWGIDKDKRLLKFGVRIINFYDCVYKNLADYSQRYLHKTFLPALQEICSVYFHHKQFEQIHIIGKNYVKYLCMMLDKSIEQKNKANKKHKKYKKLFEIALYFLILENIFLLVLFFIM